MGRFITAKFNSKCADTNQVIKKGDRIYYDGGRAYCKDAKYYKIADVSLESAYVQAQENAYFDNFCANNNI